MKLYRITYLTCAASLVGSLNLNADVIVSWGESTDIAYGFTNMSSVGKGSTTISFSNGYTSPVVGSGTAPGYYTPLPSDKTPNFYAAGYGIISSDQNPNTTPTGSITWAIGSGNPDVIQVGGQNTTADTNKSVTITKLFMWTDAEFLSPLSELTGMSLINTDNGSTVSTENRFVIQLGADYYISENFGENTGNPINPLTFSDPSLVSWFDYDPTVNIATIGSSATISDFSNLSKAGFFSTSFGTSASGNVFVQNNTRMFEVTAIPEPSSYALFAAAIGAMAVIIRRKRR